MLTGCSGDDVMATIGPAHLRDRDRARRGECGATGAGQAGGQANALVVTAQQRGYLDALTSAGVKPSSNLMALSIGSYVCQAHAAKQNDQAVWDFVLPLVRSDVRDARLSSMAPSAADVDSATADYIRIATERLC